MKPQTSHVLFLLTSLLLFPDQANAEDLESRGNNWKSIKKCHYVSQSFSIATIPSKFTNSVKADAIFYKISDLFPEQVVGSFIYWGQQEGTLKCNSTKCEVRIKDTLLETVDIARDKRIGMIPSLNLPIKGEFTYSPNSSGFWCVESHWSAKKSSGLDIKDIEGYETKIDFNAADNVKEPWYYSTLSLYLLIPFVLPLVWSSWLFTTLGPDRIPPTLPLMMLFFVLMSFCKAVHPLFEVFDSNYSTAVKSFLNILFSILSVSSEAAFELAVCLFLFRGSWKRSKVVKSFIGIRILTTVVISTIVAVMKLKNIYPYVLPYSDYHRNLCFTVPLIHFGINVASIIFILRHFGQERTYLADLDDLSIKTTESSSTFLSCWIIFGLVWGIFVLVTVHKNVSFLDDYLETSQFKIYFSLKTCCWALLFCLLCWDFVPSKAAISPQSRTAQTILNDNGSALQIELVDISKTDEEIRRGDGMDEVGEDPFNGQQTATEQPASANPFAHVASQGMVDHN